jgi:hypothetical protein
MVAAATGDASDAMKKALEKTVRSVFVVSVKV